MVDVTRQALQVISITFYKDLLTAYATKSFEKVQNAGGKLTKLIQDMDHVLSTNEYFLLGRWLDDAKRTATNATEAKRLEFNARNQITMWGPRENIEDYANKMWSGLLEDYYKERWQMFLDFLLISVYQKVPFNQTLFQEETYKLENSWNLSQKKYPVMPQGDTYSVVKMIHETYRGKSESKMLHFL